MTLSKIISGGQTGADRAALDFAIETGIPYGGWVPKGRRAEDGRISEMRYPNLCETASSYYQDRTKRNVDAADGTVIFFMTDFGKGSSLTWKLADGKPRSFMDLDVVDEDEAATKLKQFIRDGNIKVLNVAGSRASKAPFLYDKVIRILRKANSC